MNNLPPLVDDEIAYEKAGLVHRVMRPESGDGPYPTVVLIHGHLGNEDVMWIFKQTLPKDWLLVAPRAIVPFGPESFSWSAHETGSWPSLAMFAEAVARLTRFIDSLPELYDADSGRLYVMGFSQGAAAAFATAVSHPGRIKGIASLVGFMPGQVEDAIDNKRLAEVRSDGDVRVLREELVDRYGEPPDPVARLLLVASFRARAREAGVSEVTVQGKYVRFHPVDLPDSRVVRLNRLHPKSIYKAPVRTMLVPRPLPSGFGAQPPRDEELLTWARQVIDGVIVRDASQAPASTPVVVTVGRGSFAARSDGEVAESAGAPSDPTAAGDAPAPN